MIGLGIEKFPFESRFGHLTEDADATVFPRGPALMGEDILVERLDTRECKGFGHIKRKRLGKEGLGRAAPKGDGAWADVEEAVFLVLL